MRYTRRLLSLLGVAIVMTFGLITVSPSLASPPTKLTGPVSEDDRTAIMQEVKRLVPNVSNLGEDFNNALKDAAQVRYGTGVIIGLGYFTNLVGPNVVNVEPDSPADKAGLRTGDFVERLNGVSYVVDSHKNVTVEYRNKVNSESLTASNQEVSLEIVRLVLNNEKIELERKSVKLVPVMLRPDRTAEAEKLAQEINTELKPFVAKIEALAKELTEKFLTIKTWEEFFTLIDQTAKPVYDEFRRWVNQKNNQIETFSSGR